jgi:hypothetical protein
LKYGRHEVKQNNVRQAGSYQTGSEAEKKKLKEAKNKNKAAKHIKTVKTSCKIL